MKGIFFWVLSLSSTLTVAQTKTCNGDCPPESVLLCDFDINAIPENTNAELLKSLYYIAPALHKEIESGSSSCFDFLDASVIKPGQDLSLEKPPILYTAIPGEIRFCEYLLTGNITGSGSVFSLTANIETAFSRKKLKTVNIPFSFAEGDTYISVVQKTAAALGSLPDVIKEYEIKEREINMKVAYGQHAKSGGNEEQLKIKPAKSKLSMGEETEVEITLSDCDGYPLKNRVVCFTGEMYDSVWRKGTYGGTVTPSKVTTDASGRAKVKFKVGKEYAFAAIVAHYSHEQPWGKKNVITGSAAIDIQLKPYRIVVAYGMHLKELTDRQNTTSEYTETAKGNHDFHASYLAEFYYAPREPQESLAINSNDDSTICRIYFADEEGNSTDYSILHYIRKSLKGELIADYTDNINLNGKISADDKPAVGLDTSGLQTFSLALSLLTTGVFNGKEIEPDLRAVTNVVGYSLDPHSRFERTEIKDPGSPYKTTCQFSYENDFTKTDSGTTINVNEFLQIKLFIEK